MVNRRNLVTGGAVAIMGAGAVWSGARQMGSIEGYGAAMAALRAPLPATPDPRDLIRFATLAANSHNTQAWNFRAGDGRIDILPDPARRTPAVDSDDHHLFASLGSAAENLSIAAAARGLPGLVAFDAGGGGAVRFAFTAGAIRDAAVCDAIPLRQSTRADYDGSQVSAADLATLADAASMPGVELILITDRARINQVRDLVIAGNTSQIAASAEYVASQIAGAAFLGFETGGHTWVGHDDAVMGAIADLILPTTGRTPP